MSHSGIDSVTGDDTLGVVCDDDTGGALGGNDTLFSLVAEDRVSSGSC